jgi:hypothetical protein
MEYWSTIDAPIVIFNQYGILHCKLIRLMLFILSNFIVKCINYKKTLLLVRNLERRKKCWEERPWEICLKWTVSLKKNIGSKSKYNYCNVEKLILQFFKYLHKDLVWKCDLSAFWSLQDYIADVNADVILPMYEHINKLMFFCRCKNWSIFYYTFHSIYHFLIPIFLSHKIQFPKCVLSPFNSFLNQIFASRHHCVTP